MLKRVGKDVTRAKMPLVRVRSHTENLISSALLSEKMLNEKEHQTKKQKNKEHQIIAPLRLQLKMTELNKKGLKWLSICHILLKTLGHSVSATQDQKISLTEQKSVHGSFSHFRF